MSLDPTLAARAVPRGSMLHYSLLFAPEDKRPALTVVHAFRTLVQGIARATREPQVAQLKLGWWREELDRIDAGKARHPLGTEVAAVAARYEIGLAPFREMLQAAEIELDETAITTWATLGEYGRLGAGAAQRSSAVVLAGAAGKRDALDTFGARLGEAVRLTEILRDVREDANIGRVYLPLEELDRRGLTVASFRAPGDGERQGLLLDAHERAVALLDGLDQLLEEDQLLAQAPGLCLAALHRALLQKMQRCEFEFGEEKPRLNPARRLWIAWRTATRAARRKDRG